MLLLCASLLPLSFVPLLSASCIVSLVQGERLPETFKFDALITTYEIIIADVELLTSIEWRCCIIDEAHRLKNKNCRLLEGLRLFDIVSGTLCK